MKDYKTDKRTKNLTLRDIHVGDWVQVWNEESGRYSLPSKIIRICGNGTVHLSTDLDIRQENIEVIDALPITPELLIGFGFKKESTQTDILKHTDYHLIYHWGSILLKTDNSSILCEGEFFHELQQFLYSIGEMSDFEWKGIEQ